MCLRQCKMLSNCNPKLNDSDKEDLRLQKIIQRGKTTTTTTTIVVIIIIGIIVTTSIVIAIDFMIVITITAQKVSNLSPRFVGKK